MREKRRGSLLSLGLAPTLPRPAKPPQLKTARPANCRAPPSPSSAALVQTTLPLLYRSRIFKAILT